MKEMGFGTFANFVGSVLSHSINTVYAVRPSGSPKCSASPCTSHTPRPLGDILRGILLRKIVYLYREV
jgi:hypothetical protein